MPALFQIKWNAKLCFRWVLQDRAGEVSQKHAPTWLWMGLMLYKDNKLNDASFCRQSHLPTCLHKRNQLINQRSKHGEEDLWNSPVRHQDDIIIMPWNWITCWFCLKSCLASLIIYERSFSLSAGVKDCQDFPKRSIFLYRLSTLDRVATAI